MEKDRLINDIVAEAKVRGADTDGFAEKLYFALRRGMSLEMVSKMLGHENLATTQIYLDLTEEELEAAHRKYVI